MSEQNTSAQPVKVEEPKKPDVTSEIAEKLSKLDEKFKGDETKLKIAYLNLEHKLGEQGNELGSYRKELDEVKKVLAEKVKEVQEPKVPEPAPEEVKQIIRAELAKLPPDQRAKLIEQTTAEDWKAIEKDIVETKLKPRMALPDYVQDLMSTPAKPVVKKESEVLGTLRQAIGLVVKEANSVPPGGGSASGGAVNGKAPSIPRPEGGLNFLRKK